MAQDIFSSFFTGPALHYLLRSLELALDEDGPDLTSRGIFSQEDILGARIVAKEKTLLAGAPIIPLVMERCSPVGSYSLEFHARDGDTLAPGQTAALITGPAPAVLKAERVILNYITHLSGIANATRRYAEKLAGTGTRLLDTRKTLPGLRYPEKYAVRIGGGENHRLDLAEMLMLKDNHVDRAGSITQGVRAVRAAYDPCPPIEVECRNLDEVREAVACAVDRIMLDNMDADTMRESLAMIPASIESEISGNVTLETIASLGTLGADYISVGRITHSAPAADFSMQIQTKDHSS